MTVINANEKKAEKSQWALTDGESSGGKAGGLEKSITEPDAGATSADGEDDAPLTPDQLELAQIFDENLTVGSFEQVRDWIYKNGQQRLGRWGYLNALEWIFVGNEEVEPGQLLQLLGDVWTLCDNIGEYRNFILDLLGAAQVDPWTTIPELMDHEEKVALEALPDCLTIFRFCGPSNKNGFSWTLCRDVARSFRLKAFYETHQPILLTANICKQRIAALKMGRNEQEVIVFDLPETSWTEEPITPPHALNEESPRVTLRQRIISLLISRAGVIGTKKDGIEFPLPGFEQELAKELGTGSSLISAYLVQLQASGFLQLEQNKIVLTDLNRLASDGLPE